MRKIMMLASYLFILAVVGPGLHAISGSATAEGSDAVRGHVCPTGHHDDDTGLVTSCKSDVNSQSNDASSIGSHNHHWPSDHALRVKDLQMFPGLAPGHQERR